jgi:DNA-binding MarR family transcriptional regulator
VKRLHNEVAARADVVADVGELASRAMDQLFEVAVVLGDAMAHGLGAQGLTTARAELIWRLHEAGPMTQRQLSQVLRCTPRNVTGLVDALESAGYVNRGPHPTDRRASMVALTEEGRAMAAAWHASRQRGSDALFAGMPRSRLAQFVGTLDTILARLATDPSTDIRAADHTSAKDPQVK